MRPSVLLAATAMVAASTAQAQVVERHLPAKPVAEAIEPFSEIRSIRELASGRLIVLDSRDQTIQEIDLEGRDAGAIGRRGKGPGEYQHATVLIAWPGDSTAVVDGGNDRLLLIGPDAKPAGVVRNVGDEAVSPRLRAADSRGRLYLTAYVMKIGGDKFVPPDSQHIERLDPRSGRIDTMATVAAAHSEVRVNRTGNDVSSVEVSRRPFAVGDEWDVAPDGRVAIVRRNSYRLDQIMPDGRLVRGPPIPVAVLRLTEADKKEYLASLPNAGRARVASMDWPETRSPFPLRAVIAMPNGETWVHRNQAAGARDTRYDVFGPAGTLIARLILPRDRRIVAVSARWFYVARTDGDGLQYLERYPSH